MMTIIENVKLSDYNTFRTGGDARFFCVVKNLEDISMARLFARERNLNVLFLGGGSNVLISDLGFDGLVIKNEILGSEILSDDCVRFGSGFNWDDAVEFCVSNKLFGFENLSYIPGTVGASVVQNIGAYGTEVKEFVKIVEVFDFDSGEIIFLTKDQCDFSYRNSIFKKNKKWFVMSVEFFLKNVFSANIKYPDVVSRVGEDTGFITAGKMRNIIIDIRKNKLPDISEYGTAGSFFKNILVKSEDSKTISDKYPNIPMFDAENNFKKIPSGFILDKICGLKGLRVGNVGLYDRQALVVVNFGGADTKEIISFVNFVKSEVKNKIGIEIEDEVEII